MGVGLWTTLWTTAPQAVLEGHQSEPIKDVKDIEGERNGGMEWMNMIYILYNYNIYMILEMVPSCT